MPHALVSVRNLRKSFVSVSGRQTVLDGVDFEVFSHEVVAVTGPSGCGKSTLLKLLSGLILPEEGRIEVMGQDLGALDESQRARLRADSVGFIFQKFNLLPFLRVDENVELPLRLKGFSAKDRSAQALDALDFVGLRHKSKAAVAHLSGGEQQRVAVARSLACAPSVLLCDEPTGSLNEEAADDIFRLLSQLATEHGRAVVLVTHNEHLANRATRRLRLRAGRIETAHAAELTP